MTWPQRFSESFLISKNACQLLPVEPYALWEVIIKAALGRLGGGLALYAFFFSAFHGSPFEATQSRTLIAQRNYDSVSFDP